MVIMTGMKNDFANVDAFSQVNLDPLRHIGLFLNLTVVTMFWWILLKLTF